jgi:superfamily II DNA or RNA helicase
MTLKNVKLRIRYNSGDHNLIKDFYNPCLSVSSSYYRAVGYFTSYGLAIASRGIASLLNNKGMMKLIASPCLLKEDIDAINKGYENRDIIIRRSMRRELCNIEDFISKQQLEALSWMVQEGSLEVKIAFKGEANLSAGLFHEKGGVFIDNRGNKVAFNGSGNETFGGWNGNYETLNTYNSWSKTGSYVEAIESDFLKLWENKQPKVTVIDYSEVASEILRPYCNAQCSYFVPSDISEEGEYEKTNKKEISISLPEGIELRDYQKEAIRNWFSSDGQGIFKMATGSGKTMVALALAENMYQKNKSKSFVVIAPYIHLVRQWAQEASRFGFKPMSIYGSSDKWLPKLDSRLYDLDSADSPLFIIITNSGFCGSKFQSIANRLPASTLIIADEVHNLGSEKIAGSLPHQIKYRLGLSATPERYSDDEGSQRILDYFGNVLKPEYTLKQALDDNVLCPYEYKLIRIDLTDDEDVEFYRLSTAIARAYRSPEERTTESKDRYKMLVLKRARLVANAHNKLGALYKSIINHKDESHLLVYCGSGQSDDMEHSETAKHIDKVCDCVGNRIGMRIAKFTHETDTILRDSLLKKLDDGAMQCLVAIRCLDEGVDVPSIKTAFIMASTANPRQHIQRRGRLLRKHSGKKYALIYDFLVLPSLPQAGDKAISSLVRTELKRAYEFGMLARNSGEATKLILDWGLEYGVTVFDGINNED